MYHASQQRFLRHAAGHRPRALRLALDVILNPTAITRSWVRLVALWRPVLHEVQLLPRQSPVHTKPHRGIARPCNINPDPKHPVCAHKHDPKGLARHYPRYVLGQRGAVPRIATLAFTRRVVVWVCVTQPCRAPCPTTTQLRRSCPPIHHAVARNCLLDRRFHPSPKRKRVLALYPYRCRAAHTFIVSIFPVGCQSTRSRVDQSHGPPRICAVHTHRRSDLDCPKR
jgi:hypothetical protein